MREITSRDNRIVKLCEQLAARKYRDRLGLYLIEEIGRASCRERV